MEDKVIFNTDIEDVPKVEVPKVQKKPVKQTKVRVENNESMEVTSCLRNEKIKVKFIERNNGLPSNHVLSGGMAEGSKITLVVPRLNTGTFVNVLTDSEKSFLEEYMGLEYNALSIYKKPDEENFWNDAKITIKIL